MATMAMAIALFGVLWPLMVLALARFCITCCLHKPEYMTRLFKFKFSIICLGNCVNCKRSTLNSSPLDSTKAPPLDPIPRFIHGWSMAIALFKTCRRLWLLVTSRRNQRYSKRPDCYLCPRIRLSKQEFIFSEGLLLSFVALASASRAVL